MAHLTAVSHETHDIPRRVGPVYQFRHIDLQRHYATSRGFVLAFISRCRRSARQTGAMDPHRS
jgi:hypothetical protein